MQPITNNVYVVEIFQYDVWYHWPSFFSYFQYLRNFMSGGMKMNIDCLRWNEFENLSTWLEEEFTTKAVAERTFD